MSAIIKVVLHRGEKKIKAQISILRGQTQVMNEALLRIAGRRDQGWEVKES